MPTTNSRKFTSTETAGANQAEHKQSFIWLCFHVALAIILYIQAARAGYKRGLEAAITRTYVERTPLAAPDNFPRLTRSDI